MEKAEAISLILLTIPGILHVNKNDITNIEVMKKGMTNCSFLFSCKNKKYILRIPGEGTEQLINRREEAAVYEQILDKNISDKVIYINSDNGYKITEFIENARVCDASDERDLRLCMSKLKEFHNLRLKVDHEFDLFYQIEFYESLRKGTPSVYKDYKITKEKVFSLRKYVEKYTECKCLVHIDAVSDNFIFSEEGDVKLIDWEYAGMQDPHVDIAMFCIYSLYDKVQTDKLIDIYFDGACPKEIRIKIYCYMSIGGLLWSNWCEYKRTMGIEFGEYSLHQYMYAKEFYELVKKELSI